MLTLNSFFIATGSNLYNRGENLEVAKLMLARHFNLIAESRIYESSAVEYLEQPDFYNQVLEFKMTDDDPQSVMALLLNIENEMGRKKIIPKGPRIIDLDILFWGFKKIQTENLIIPHPRLFERSFVVLPLMELPGFLKLKDYFFFNDTFDNQARILQDKKRFIPNSKILNI